MNIKYSVQDIVESSVLIALAIVLDFIKIPVGATGGSISFTMLPLFILAIRQGFLKGFLGIGIVYGLITCLKDGYGIETFPFDYLLGYGSISIVGLFSKQILDDKKPAKSIVFLIFSGVFATFLRLMSSTISSMIIYDYEFVPAIVYNALYIPLSGIVSIAIILLLYKPLLMVNNKFPTKRID